MDYTGCLRGGKQTLSWCQRLSDEEVYHAVMFVSVIHSNHLWMIQRAADLENSTWHG